MGDLVCSLAVIEHHQGRFASGGGPEAWRGGSWRLERDGGGGVRSWGERATSISGEMDSSTISGTSMTACGGRRAGSVCKDVAERSAGRRMALAIRHTLLDWRPA